MTPRDELLNRLAGYERQLGEMLAAMRVVVGAMRRSDVTDADAAAALAALDGCPPR
jgi:hypothetical protein